MSVQVIHVKMELFAEISLTHINACVNQGTMDQTAQMVSTLFSYHDDFSFYHFEGLHVYDFFF